MQNKAKIVAICGICGAVSALCLMALGIPGTNWVALILAVVSSVAVSIPMMVSGKLVYSLLTYFASAIIGVLTSTANILYVAPVVSFCMPMALVKIYAETLKVSTQLKQHTIADPFDNGDDKQVVAVELDAQPRLKKIFKWILYYIILEVGIVLTLLATALMTPTTFSALVQNKYFVLVLVVAQLLPILYDLLLRGAFALVSKTLRRYISHE